MAEIWQDGICSSRHISLNDAIAAYTNNSTAQFILPVEHITTPSSTVNKNVYLNLNEKNITGPSR